MKRRLLGFALVALVAAGLLAILLRVLGSMPGADVPGWRSTLQQYIGYRAAGGAAEMRIASAELAARPWEFSREMSVRTFGGSTYYQVDVAYGGRNGLKPLPYPPEEAWCVRLDGSADVAGRWVLVARYEDLYNADWIVHEPAGDTPGQQAAILAQIGCR